MKVVSVLLFVFALFVIIFPQFYTCQAHGFAIELPKGTIPMRCFYTAHALACLGAILAVMASGLWFFRQRETRIILSILGIITGLFMLLLVTRVGLFGIGICVNPDMPCVIYMCPAIYMVAPIIMVTSLVGLLLSLRARLGMS